MAWFRDAGPVEYGTLFELNCVGVDLEDMRRECREWRRLVETGQRTYSNIYIDVGAVFGHFDWRRCQDIRTVVLVAANAWSRAE